MPVRGDEGKPVWAIEAGWCALPTDWQGQPSPQGSDTPYVQGERLDRALARGAHIYAEVLGYGMSADGYHITLPRPGGAGAARSMEAALADAGLGPGDLDYINAHGTSTAANDATETAAIKTVFGDAAHDIPISSTKSL